jgi:uroporphyrin-III C-methyltransferase/precorrin-2 dehydrogenase/sirohydrochlorin ferrochelatase/uroporphyrin-III C-methyltransferase
MAKGCVYLVGAGPGDPDLLTVKALRLIGAADVVVYDRLVSAPILGLIPTGTPRIFAGKRAGYHHLTQSETNELLLKLARAGRQVVRLKGGDPFIFGRGSEEAEHLARHGIRFEVVPGVTAAAGCAAYAGIPLTHRGLANNVRLVTGHGANDGSAEIDWASYADPDSTLVIYMGATRLEYIAAQLLAGGLPPETPAAAIQDGTNAGQRRVLGTLASLPGQVLACRLGSPTLVVIGRVVALAEALDWLVPAAVAVQPSVDCVCG